MKTNKFSLFLLTATTTFWGLLLAALLLTPNAALAIANSSSYIKLWAPPGWVFVSRSDGENSSPLFVEPDHDKANGYANYLNTPPGCVGYGGLNSPNSEDCRGQAFVAENCVNGFNAAKTEFVATNSGSTTPNSYGPRFLIDMTDGRGHTVTLYVHKGGKKDKTDGAEEGLTVQVGKEQGSQLGNIFVIYRVWQYQYWQNRSGQASPNQNCANPNDNPSSYKDPGGCAAVVEIAAYTPVSQQIKAAPDLYGGADLNEDCAYNIYPTGRPTRISPNE